MQVLVLIVSASILVICVCGSCLPWFLPVFLNGGLFVFASSIVMVMIASMSRAVVCNLEPMLTFVISVFDADIGTAC